MGKGGERGRRLSGGRRRRRGAGGGRREWVGEKGLLGFPFWSEFVVEHVRERKKKKAAAGLCCSFDLVFKGARLRSFYIGLYEVKEQLLRIMCFLRQDRLCPKTLYRTKGFLPIE